MSKTHGLAGTYRNGCRCEPCRIASTDRAREERRRRTETLATDPTVLVAHGSAHTYKNWGCRCRPCTEANSRSCQQYKTHRRNREVPCR